MAHMTENDFIKLIRQDGCTNISDDQILIAFKNITYCCLICKKQHPDIIGKMVPKEGNEADFLCEPGSVRVFWYALCNECSCVDGISDEIDNHFKRLVRRQDASMFDMKSMKPCD